MVLGRRIRANARDWEEIFTHWAKPPGKTEEERCQNSIKIVRNAIASSNKLRTRGIRIFPQGSYRNRVNIRQESDVDVGVLCHDVFFPQYPTGSGAADYGNIDGSYSYPQFKNELEEAMVSYLGRQSVHRGNKALHITETSYHVEADVVPFFEFRQYFRSGKHRCGVALHPDNDIRLIENYPERLLDSWPMTPLHYENGVAKNSATRRAYKGVTRILKNLRAEMESVGIAAAKPIPGFLIECLLWNAPDTCFTHQTWAEDVLAVLTHLSLTVSIRSSEWLEVNGVKYLFHPNQGWTVAEVLAFLFAAQTYIGARS